jgi:hypothetical protein
MFLTVNSDGKERREQDRKNLAEAMWRREQRRIKVTHCWAEKQFKAKQIH